MAVNVSTTNLVAMSESLRYFGVADYIVFAGMLLGCAAIGVYYGFFAGHVDAEVYLVGGRQMHVLPVALSLIGSFISGITLLGTPTELYLYGTQYLFVFVSLFLMIIVMSAAYLPVFHDLRITSSFEYLELRFGKSARVFGSVLFTVSAIFWIPIVIYMPALAFNQVTGVNVHIVTPAVSMVCIFYTCVGGLKAVVWTDVVQTVMMFGAVVLVIIKGTIDIGGLGVVLQRNWDSGRIQLPDPTADPTVRHSWLSVLLGGFFGMLPFSVSQMALQRLSAIDKRRNAVTALGIYSVGATCLSFMCAYGGLLIYATYYDCDPLTTKLARASDQLLPVLVMNTLDGLPGLPGLFVAGVFSAALSSMSSALNSMSAVVLEDFFKMFSSRQLTERQTNVLMKSVVVVFGAVTISLVFLVEKLGTMLQLSSSLGSITSGPTLGVFTSGIFFPWTNTKGAVLGGTTGMAVMGWIILNAQAHIATGDITFARKPVSVEGCLYEFARPNITAAIHEPAYVMPLYRVSYLMYSLMGFTVTLVAALLISLVTGPRRPADIDRRLLSPVIRWMLPPEEVKPGKPRADSVRDAYGYKMVNMEIGATENEKKYDF